MKRLVFPQIPWADAEDLAQTSVIKILLKQEQVENGERFHAWWLTTVRRTALDYLRKVRRTRVESWPLHALQAHAEANPTPTLEERRAALGLDQVEVALAELDPESREIIVMRYFEEMTEQAISDRYGVSRRSGQRKIKRALGDLKRKIEELEK